MKKKKLLYLSLNFPIPADSGGKIKTLNSIITLSKLYRINSVFISGNITSSMYVNELKKRGIQVKNFYKPETLVTVKENISRMLINLIHGNPYYKYQYSYADIRDYVNNQVKYFKPDIIHIDHLAMAQYLPVKKKETWILELHNLEPNLLMSRLINTPYLKSKLYLIYETFFTLLYEYKYIKKFDHIFCISNSDQLSLNKRYHINNTSAQKLVYPLTHKVKRSIHSNKNHILFIGSLVWPPNFEAVRWFLVNVYPDIVQKFKSVEFHTVGAIKKDILNKLPQHSSVFHHGYQNNINQFLKEAKIFIMPFKVGGGVRIKSLTALSAGLPLVTTSLGIEGLNVEKGEHCLIANTSRAFSECVVRLLSDKKLRQKLSKNAIKYIKDNHGEDLNKKFLKEYNKIILARSQQSTTQ